MELNAPQSPDVLPSLRTVARILRQRRRLRLAVRATWLALAVWCIGLFARLIGISLQPFLMLGLAILVLLVGLAYAWLSHPSLARLAHGLDDHYELSQQLSTAVEVTRRGATYGVETRLLSETQGLLSRMRRYFASQPLVPWREVETLVAVALLAIGLTAATSPLLPIAQAPVALPDLPAPAVPTDVAQPLPSDQPVAEKEEPQQLTPEAQAASDAIADALRDNGATRSAAEALDQGNPEEAASDLRELADQADQLSDQARNDIAEGLRGAADQLRESQPGLADQLEQQADALERGGQEAAQALEDLARTVEQLDNAGEQAAQAQQPADQAGGQGQQPADQQQGQQSGPGQGAGEGLGGEQRGAQNGGVQAQGDDLPLPQASPAGGPTTNARGPRGPVVSLDAGGTGATRNGDSRNADQPLPGAADPLAIPSEYRDVVEEYFSPE